MSNWSPVSTPVSSPTEALWKDALSENQFTEGASDI